MRGRLLVRGFACARARAPPTRAPLTRCLSASEQSKRYANCPVFELAGVSSAATFSLRKQCGGGFGALLSLLLLLLPLPLLPLLLPLLPLLLLLLPLPLPLLLLLPLPLPLAASLLCVSLDSAHSSRGSQLLACLACLASSSRSVPLLSWLAAGGWVTQTWRCRGRPATAHGEPGGHAQTGAWARGRACCVRA